MGAGMPSLGDFNPAMLVHGEQSVELHREIPVKGTLRSTGKVEAIYDKGKGAVIVMSTSAVLADTNEPLFTNTMSVFIRGEGGFGGDRGPSGPQNVPPDRAPTTRSPTRPARTRPCCTASRRPQPAALRPQVRRDGRVPQAILHGLCTYAASPAGPASHPVRRRPRPVPQDGGRFSSPVFPGEALTVNIMGRRRLGVFQTVAATAVPSSTPASARSAGTRSGTVSSHPDGWDGAVRTV